MGFLFLIGIGVTYYVWTELGWPWGLVAGFFLIGGVGWRILAGLFGAVLPGRRDKQEFVSAWEARAGPMAFGRSHTYPPSGLYQEWRREAEQTGISARAFLEDQVGVASGPTRTGYEGQATDEKGRTTYPWESEEFRGLREELKHVPSPNGGLDWGVISRGSIGYYESLAFVLNKHVGGSKLGQQYLQYIVEGLDMTTSHERAIRYLKSAGRDEAESLRGPNATEDEIAELAAQGIGMAQHYTGQGQDYEGSAEIARLAKQGALTPERVRSIPDQYLPPRIAGLGHPEENAG